MKLIGIFSNMGQVVYLDYFMYDHYLLWAIIPIQRVNYVFQFYNAFRTGASTSFSLGSIFSTYSLKSVCECAKALRNFVYMFEAHASIVKKIRERK